MKWIPRGVRLTSVMAGIVVISLVLALIAQHRTADRRERALNARFAETLMYRLRREHMDRFLGDLGFATLRGADRGERLAVARDGEVVAGGPEVNAEAIRSLSASLLSPSHYGYVNCDDDPEPRFGLRLTRDGDTLDVLFDTISPGHQDVWIVTRDHARQVVHRAGPVGFNDPSMLRFLADPGP